MQRAIWNLNVCYKQCFCCPFEEVGYGAPSTDFRQMTNIDPARILISWQFILSAVTVCQLIKVETELIPYNTFSTVKKNVTTYSPQA